MRERLHTLLAAIAICVDDRGVTDMGTLKRMWFYAQTGRDEPVGSLSWVALRALSDAPAGEVRRMETQSGSTREHAVTEGQAPVPSPLAQEGE